MATGEDFGIFEVIQTYRTAQRVLILSGGDLVASGHLEVPFENTEPGIGKWSLIGNGAQSRGL